MTEAQCLRMLIDFLTDDLSAQPGSITAQTQLAKDLSIDAAGCIPLAKWINRSTQHTAHVLPGEVARCKTVGALAKLIFQRAH